MIATLSPNLEKYSEFVCSVYITFLTTHITHKQLLLACASKGEVVGFKCGKASYSPFSKHIWPTLKLDMVVAGNSLSE